MARIQPKRSGLQLPLWEPTSDWKVPDASALPAWPVGGRVGLDTETCDPTLRALGCGVRRGGRLVGVSFAVEDGPSYYLPFGHRGGDNLPRDAVLGYVREQARAFRGTIVGTKLDYDLDYLAEEGVEFDRDVTFADVTVVEPLINELRLEKYSLDNIAGWHALPGKDETLLKEAVSSFCGSGANVKESLHLLPARFVGPYAECDSALPLKILRKQERIVEMENLWDVYRLECAVLPVLLRMRRRGVLIDQDHLEKVERWARQQELDSLKIVNEETGVSLAPDDVWKADALAPALRAIGIRVDRTPKTGKDKIDKTVLSGDHPVLKALGWARKTNKLRTTFVKSVKTYLTNGRIHCTFNQIARETENGDQRGARYGRLSCVDPNLQQQPSKDEFASFFRKIYIPEKEAMWGSADYSQQEPRWTTHFAARLKLPGARETAQAYHDDPNLDNHQFMANLTGLRREYAKCVYLGVTYGEGGAKLCRDLGLPTRWTVFGNSRRLQPARQFFREAWEAYEWAREHGGKAWEVAGEEGQRILNAFDERAPFIRKLASHASEVARKRGYVRCADGRVLHFPQKEDLSYDWTHKALNRLIQGSGAGQMKKAMVVLDAEGYFLQLQVHDEADSSVANASELKRIGNIMKDIMPALVPFRVDCKIGPSWGELK